MNVTKRFVLVCALGVCGCADPGRTVQGSATVTATAADGSVTRTGFSIEQPVPLVATGGTYTGSCVPDATNPSFDVVRAGATGFGLREVKLTGGTCSAAHPCAVTVRVDDGAALTASLTGAATDACTLRNTFDDGDADVSLSCSALTRTGDTARYALTVAMHFTTCQLGGE